jgi:hypothetical protein
MAYAAHLDYSADLAHVGIGVSASSAAAAYPASNVQSLPISKPWRATGCAAEYVEIDLGSAKSFNLVALVNHNLTSAAVITVNLGNVPNPGTISQQIVWRRYDAFLLFGSLQTYRYIRITITDSGNPAAIVSVGAVLIGNAPTLTFGFNFGWKRADIDNNLTVQSEFNAVNVKPLNYQIALAHQYDQLTDAMMETLRAVHRAAQTNVYPLFWIPDADVNDGYMVRFDAAFTALHGLRSSAQIGFVEDSRGQAVGA